MEQLIPTVIATSALGLLWYYIRTSIKENKVIIKDFKNESDLRDAKLELRMESSEKEIAEKFLTKEDHARICKIDSLEMQQYFTEELTQLKDEIFKKLRELETLIKDHMNNDRRQAKNEITG